MLTILEAKKQFKALFGRQSFTDEAEISLSLVYLEKMLVQSSIRLDSFDITPFLIPIPDKTTVDMIRSKALINRKLFELREAMGHTEDLEAEIDKVNKVGISLMNKGSRFADTSRALRDLQHKMDQAQYEYYRAVRCYQEALARGSEMPKGSYYSPFWDLEKDPGNSHCGYIQWRSKNNVVLTQVDPALGLNLSYDFGKIVIRFKTISNTTFYSVKSDRGPFGCYADLQLHNTDYWHPHISSSGSICYGNAAVHIEKAIAVNDFTKALEFLWTILNQYNSDSPYRGLDRFCADRDQALAEREARISETLPPITQERIDAQMSQVINHVSQYRADSSQNEVTY